MGRNKRTKMVAKSTIEEKIKEVQNYFVNKIMAGEFEIIFKDSRFFVTIIVDSKYRFMIWTANSYDPSSYLHPYDGIGKYFMQLEFSDDQAASLKEIIKTKLS
ncbi:MAG: hypothetical protein WC720_05160 [Candidatus Shapirobacteria bacterium]|jgi:hypothetical protein